VAVGVLVAVTSTRSGIGSVLVAVTSTRSGMGSGGGPDVGPARTWMGWGSLLRKRSV
jgi:hypothetical protein